MTPDELRSATRGDAAAICRVADALRARNIDEIAPAAADLDPKDRARLIMRLRPDAARGLLRTLPDAPCMETIAVLDNAIGNTLLDSAQERRIARVLADLPVTEAADFLHDAPTQLVEMTLAAAGPSGALSHELDHRRGSAAAVMRRRLVAAPKDWTMQEVIDDLRGKADEIDRIYAVYVIDDQRRLLGYLKIRDLLLLPAATRVGDAMRTDTSSLPPTPIARRSWSLPQRQRCRWCR